MVPSRLLRLPVLFVLLAAFLVGGCGNASSEGDGEASRTNLVDGAKREPAVNPPQEKAPKKLVVRDLREGVGIEARKGDALITKFIAKDTGGGRFESSWDPGEQPFIFELGAEEASPGWEKGLPGMRVGGKRELIVPNELASRFGPLPDGEDFVYVVELIGVIPPDVVERKEPRVATPKDGPPEDLQVRDLIKGSGATVRTGDRLTIEYLAISADGTRVGSSWKRSEPVRFTLGAGDSLPLESGWEEGLEGMRVGGRRELVLPLKLLRKDNAAKGGAASDALVYVVDLIGITETGEVQD
jgi:peptidylprolyl isomerase